MKTNKNKGFTLIELLIVIAIIGMLSTISLFALNQARTQARNGTRKADLESIRSALELYKADCDVYPSGSGGAVSVLGDPFTGAVGSCNSNTYLQDTPADPVSGSYYYSSLGSTYVLCSHLENSTITVSGCGTCGPGTCRYKVTNP
jgi:general secretion pathway protein G